jgi:hypothetical protein
MFENERFYPQTRVQDMLEYDVKRTPPLRGGVKAEC